MLLRTLSIILITLFCLPLGLFAQKLDKRTVKLTYLRKPLRPLDKSLYQTYSRSLFRGFLEIPNERRLVESNLRIEGFQVAPREGDIHLELTLRGLNFLSKEEQSDEENGLRKNYRYRVRYAFPALLTLTDRSGKVLDRFFIQQPDEALEVSFGEGFNTQTSLVKAWRAQKYTFLEEQEERQIQRVFSEARRFLADRYAYTVATDKIRIGIGEGKFDYQDLRKAADLAQEGYLQVTLKNRQKAQENLEAAIEIWLAAIQEADLDSRRSRINKKILRWLHHNCANAYLWLNEFERAIMHNTQATTLGLTLNPLSESFIRDLQARHLANP